MAKGLNINTMGMYDSVWIKCPQCGTENEFQSKSGDCSLRNYTLENCPEDVLANVNRHSPIHCECGAAYSVDMFLKKPILVDTPTQSSKQTTMEKKQTAVQWLIENAKGFHNAESSKAMQEKALQMEREQIEKARQDGHESTYNSCQSGCSGREELDGSNANYYAQTYQQ